jgi:hypothetical protein
MKGVALLAAAVLAAAGCARTELRYAPAAASELAPAGLAPVASIEFRDASDGLHSEGAGLTLARPFFDVFRDAASAQLGALKVAAAPGAGAALEVELTSASLRRGSGFSAALDATVKYSILVRRGGETACRQDVVGWATMKEGFASSPAAETLRRGLARAMENLGPALAASCLAPASGSAPAAPAAPRDAKTWALVVGIGRYRGRLPAVAGAQDDARAAAEYAKSALGVPADQVVVIVDEMATLADLQKYLRRWVPDHVGPDGKVFVAFFGRAAAAGRDSFLLPYDADADYVDETGLSFSRLCGELARLPGRAEVVLGAGVDAARPAQLPNNVHLFAAGKDPRAAFDAARADWKAW